MKHLTLLRHAKSSWDHPGLGDHGRPLNARGQRDAPRVGRALAELYEQEGIGMPQQAFVSSAERTRETAGLVLPEIGSPASEILDDLYLASPGTMLRVLAHADEDLDHLLLIAHNPGTADLADLLATDPPLEAYPTCCATVLRLEIEAWGLLEERTGHRVAVIKPRDLSA